jgi:hypothetical protein
MTATTSIPLAALPAPIDPTRRDQWGRYLVLPPDDDKPVGYTRATTVAGALDDGYGLQKWLATMAICGTLARPGLRAQWEALLALHDGDPWYASDEAKTACKRLVDECAAVGGANDRSEIGTARHEITAAADAGRPLTNLSPETQADLDAYYETLAAAGVELDADAIELMVVLDNYRVAGTLDRIASAPRFRRRLITDLKTGADLAYSWHAIAVQLAIYAHGDAVYRQGPAEDGSQDERLPMPDVDLDNALVIWLPANTGRCELFLVDIAAGWEAFTHSLWAREWRKRDVAMPLEGGGFKPATTDLSAALTESLTQLKVEVEETIVADLPDFTVALRAWLQSRIDTIGAAGAEPRRALINEWPEGVASLQSSTEHTPEQLTLIEGVLDVVERRHRIVFPEPRPTADPLGLVLHIFPNSTDVTPDAGTDPQETA